MYGGTELKALRGLAKGGAYLGKTAYGFFRGANAAKKGKALLNEVNYIKKITEASLSTEKTASLFQQNFITRETATLSRGAENVNAAVNLNKKLSQLEGAQQSAVNIRNLLDGRIRYYDMERTASKIGPTRGRSYVTEFNPETGNARTWMECYDHAGKVNRVHPKQINGQEFTSPHYPPTARELGL